MTTPLNKFDDARAINSYFENWPDLPEGERLDIIRGLKKTGTLTAVKTKPDKSFKCPIHAFHLARPCGLTECQFHLEHGQSRNCLVYAVTTAKNSRLSAPEAAEVLNITVSDVNTFSNTAMSKIRKTLIKDRIDRFRVSKFNYIAGHCINCELYMQVDIDMGMPNELMVEKQFGWCSSDCKKTKPKWQFEMEVEFGCHFLDVLAAGLAVYGKVEAVDQLFSIPTGYTAGVKRLLYDRIDRLHQ